MTVPLVIAMPGNEAMAQMLTRSLRGDIGGIELRSFPDGETYLRFLSHLSGRVLVIACTLDRPNEKILPLLFAAATARELDAERSAWLPHISPTCGKIGASSREKP